MKKQINLVVIVGVIYAIAIAGLASGNLIHNYLVNKGNRGNQFDNGFNMGDEELPPLESSSAPASDSEPSSLVEGSDSSVGSLTSSSLAESSSTGPTIDPVLGEIHSVTRSPYAQTTITPLLDNHEKDSRGYDVKYYTVDIKLKKISDLRTFLVTEDGYPGDTITDTVSNQVRTVEASLNTNVLAAISGDSAFSYAHRPGYVIRNGSIIRDTRRNGDDATNPDCILWKDGTMSSVWEADWTPEQLIQKGALQSWMFGPNLIDNGQAVVNASSEIVSETMAQGGNQRCAIGYLGPFHYMFFVSQGRIQQNRDGFILFDMAKILLKAGCKYAYNLDGGGSATIVVRKEDDPSPVKKYPAESAQRKLGDMIYVADL